jgi:hypothetical protein
MTGSTEENLATIWEALETFRENSIPEGTDKHDDEWGNICLAMANIREELGLPPESIEMLDGEEN